ncbi:hypothetical protein JNW90_28995 [Micromonospora sp. STR1s_5]|nr:hypothetical protein [Micromonospora sp. STR1s_5]
METWVLSLRLLSETIQTQGAALPNEFFANVTILLSEGRVGNPRGVRWAGLVLAVALLALGVGRSEAAEALDSLEGVWSRDLDTCSLTSDEDELRIAIESGQLTDYQETCRVGYRSPRNDGSTLVTLQCGSARRLMRVFPKSLDSAVFYLPENKRPRSRDMIRCPVMPINALPGLSEPNEAWNKIREPRRLIKLWLDARQRCRSGVSVAREEACADRRQLGALLRSMRLCHFTRGSREGWRACSRGG